MILKVCFKGFAACWAIVCCLIVVLWHPTEMPGLCYFRRDGTWFLGIVAELFGVYLGAVCAR